MNILAVVLVIALWPMTFIVRRWENSMWMAGISGLLSAFFIVNALRHPEQWAFNALFALLAFSASLRAFRGAPGTRRRDGLTENRPWSEP